MKYQILEYDANAPTTKSIKVPVNSAYGVAVKVYRDGEEADVKTDELSVNGQTASGQQNDYNIFELSSGSDIGMTNFDVDVQKLPTVYEEINPTAEAINSTSRTRSYTILAPLSTYFDSDIIIAPEDVKVNYLKNRSVTYTDEYPDEWTDISTSQLVQPNKWLAFLISSGNIVYCMLNDAQYPFSWYYQNAGRYEYGKKTIPLEASIVLYAGMVPAHKKVEYTASIEIDTKDGFKTKFPLQVMQTDTNYFEI